MVMLNSSGTLDDIADGSNGQVLTTNGSGTYSFTTVSGGGGSSTGYVVASTSGQIDMTSPSTYYYGGNRHGWDTDDTYNGYSGQPLSRLHPLRNRSADHGFRCQGDWLSRQHDARRRH